MADFSISDVAFTGFRVIRERPKALAVWVVIQVILAVAMLLLMAQTMAPAMSQLQQATGPHPDPNKTLAAMAKLIPFYLLAALFSLLVYPVIYAAMNRAVLQPSNDRFAYLRLGADELRQLGLMLLYGLIMFGLYMATAIASAIIMVIVGMVAGSGGKPSVVVFTLMPMVILLVVAAVMAFFGVRFCLASPLTFATRKIDLFGSWTLTKGRFWPIFGTLVVVFCVSLALYVLIGVIAVAVSFATGAGFNITTFIRPDYSSPSAFLSPARIVLQLVSATLGTVFIPLWITPPAAIFASITSASANSAAGRARIDEVFS